MTALLVEPLKRGGGSNRTLCDNNRTHRSTKYASHKVAICGWPAGRYCPACAKAWQELWDNTLNRELEPAA